MHSVHSDPRPTPVAHPAAPFPSLHINISTVRLNTLTICVHVCPRPTDYSTVKFALRPRDLVNFWSVGRSCFNFVRYERLHFAHIELTGAGISSCMSKTTCLMPISRTSHSWELQLIFHYRYRKHTIANTGDKATRPCLSAQGVNQYLDVQTCNSLSLTRT